MKTLLLILLLSSSALAAPNNLKQDSAILTRVGDVQGIKTYENMVRNPGFEYSTTVAIGYTAATGTIAPTGTPPIGRGSYSGVFTPSAAGGYVESSIFTTPLNLVGKNGAASLYYVTAGTGHKLQFRDSTNLLSEVTLPASPDTSTYLKAVVNAPMPVSAKMRIVAGSTDPIRIDDLFLGDAFAENIGTVAQGYDGAFGGTGSTYAPTPCGSIACTIYSGSSWIDNVVRNGAGYYTVNVKGFTIDNSRTCHINQTTFNSSPGNTIAIASYTSSSFSFRNYNYTGGVDDTAVTIHCSPSASQIVTTPDLSPALWNGYHTAASFWDWNFTGTSYFDPAVSATGALTAVSSQNITCTSAGSASNWLPGLTCTVPKVGYYEYCASSAFEYNGTTGRAVGFGLYDGAAIVGEQPGGRIGTDITNHRVNVCGIVNHDSLAAKTTKLQAIGSSTGFHAYMPSGGAQAGLSTVWWTVKPWTQGSVNPYILNSVSTSAAGGVRVEYVEVPDCSPGACTITRQSGGIASVTGAGSGVYDIVFSPAFSSAPVCVGNSRSNRILSISGTPSASSYQVTIASDSGTPGNLQFFLQCVGPK
jgi:hypothetical protein